MTAPRRPRAHRPSSGGKVFRGVLDSRPYADPPLSTRDWTTIPPKQVRLDDLITTKAELRLDVLLAEDSTFFDDMFCHVVEWQGELYLDDAACTGPCRRPCISGSGCMYVSRGCPTTATGSTRRPDPKGDLTRKAT